MSLVESALKYAAWGWAVFPLHGVHDGRCACGKMECAAPGKHPIHRGGYKNATTDAQTIAGWWKTHPGANIGIATGQPSQLLVIDVDCGAGKDGFASLKALEREFGPLPRSARVTTGSGGLHIYLRMPDQAVKCSAGSLAKYLDVRADGGHVVAPPSMHISGKNYEWETPNE